MALVLWTALAMLAFSGNSVLGRMALLDGGLDAWTFALIRLSSGAAMLAVLLVARRAIWGQAVWPGARGRPAGVLGLLIYLFGFSAAYWSLATGTGAVILFGAVQITMFGGALIAHEAVSARRWVGVVVAFAGLVFLVAPGFVAGEVLPSVLMALSGVGWGIYSLAGRQSTDALAGTAWNFILAVPFAALVWAVLGADVVAWRGVWLAVLSGAVTSALGYALWYRLLPQLGATRASVAQLTVPVLASAGGLLMIGEAISLRFVISAAVVLTGVALASR